MESESACKWGMKYRSVIGFGKASFIDDPESKQRALDIIMQHYSDKPFSFAEGEVKKTAIVKIDIESMTGKKAGY